MVLLSLWHLVKGIHKDKWTRDERKAANLDQRLKSIIMSVLPDDQMNSIINCRTANQPGDGPDTILIKGALLCVKESRGRDWKVVLQLLNIQQKSPFQPKLLYSSEYKPKLRYTKDFEAKYTKVKAKLALLSSSASSPKSSSGKNKGLIAESYEWNEEEVSSDENETIEVKALMTLTNEERVSVSIESANNGEWVKISIQKVHTLLEMEDNDDRKSFLDYLCIDINYVEEQRNNLLSKHRNLVQELNTCKEQLLILNQAKLNLLTMQHCISEQIPTQKKKILGIDQLTEDTSSSGLKDPVFVKSSADKLEVSITGSNKPKLSKAEDSTLSNHDTGKHLLPPLEKLAGAKPVPGPKTIKSNLKSNPTFKAETLKGITLKEPSSAPAKDNKKGSSASKTSSAPAGKLKNVKVEDDPPLAIVMKELNELKLQLSKKKSSHFRNHQPQQTSQHHTGQGDFFIRSMPSRPVISFPSCIHCGYNDHQSDDCVYYPRCELYGSYDHDTQNHNMINSLRRGIKPRNPQHVTKHCETCGSNAHTTTDHNDIEWFRKGEAKKAGVNKTASSNVPRSKTPTQRLLAQIWEVPGPEGMYVDDSTYTTKGHGLVKLWCMFLNMKSQIMCLSDQNGQDNQYDHNDQNDYLFQTDEFLNDDQSLNTYPLQMEDTLVHDTISKKA
ncbi:hypothetical protein Tco_0139905 [Tanacetum coccineum]